MVRPSESACLMSLSEFNTKGHLLNIEFMCCNSLQVAAFSRTASYDNNATSCFLRCNSVSCEVARCPLTNILEERLGFNTAGTRPVFLSRECRASHHQTRTAGSDHQERLIWTTKWHHRIQKGSSSVLTSERPSQVLRGLYAQAIAPVTSRSSADGQTTRV